MGLVQIWDIVWQNEPFHWVTAAVLLIAVIYEVYTLWQYWHSDCSTTEVAIKFLRKLQSDKNAQPTDKRVRWWLNAYSGTDDSSKLRQLDGKFVLIESPSVLARPIPRSSLRFVTTLCTAIGVLGTFYGIQQGLQGINLSTENSKELIDGSKQLLEGMKTAFSTSLMGLGSGSLFTLVLFVCDTLRQKRRDALRQRLNAIALLETADNGNREVAAKLSRVAERLTKLNQPSAEAIGQAVGRSIAENFVGLNQLSAEIGQAVGEQMQAAIVPALQTIFQEQKKLRELQENQGQRVLEELIQDLRVQVLEPIADRLDKSAELTQQASQAVQTLHSELGGISQSLASSILTIQNFQQQTLGELQKFAHNLGQTLSQFQTETKSVLEQTALEINRAVNQSIEGMTAQRSAFEASADQAAATFRGIREELQAALQQRAEVEQRMLQATQTGIIQILTQANITFEEQTNTLETVGNQASELMNNAREHLLGTLGNIDQTLTVTRQIVQEDLTRFREEYQAKLQTFLEQQNNLLEGTLGRQRNGLAEVVRNLDTVFQEEANRRNQLVKEVDQSMIKISHATEKVGELATAVGLNSSQRWEQMKLLASDIGRQVQSVENSYRNLDAKFDQSLTAWHNHLESCMRQTVDLQVNFFQQADTAMARVCGGLLHTAEVLLAVKKNDDIGNGSNHHG